MRTILGSDITGRGSLPAGCHPAAARRAQGKKKKRHQVIAQMIAEIGYPLLGDLTHEVVDHTPADHTPVVLLHDYTPIT